MSGRAKGVVSILASAFGFALMAMFVRLCDDYGPAVSCFQKSFFRNLIALVIAAAVFGCSRRREAHPHIPTLDGRAWTTLMLRCVFGSLGIVANFYALSHIPIGEGMALNKTAPLFTVLFAWGFLGERMSKRQFLWLFAAFAGMMFVVKPGFGDADAAAMVCALSGGLFAGAAYACLRQLGRLAVKGAFIVLFFSAFSCLMTVPFIVFDYTPMTAAQVFILLAAGAGAAIGQFGITLAYRFAEPRSIAIFDYMNIVFTALLGFAFFGQVPDVVSVAGFVLIAVSTVGCSAPTK